MLVTHTGEPSPPSDIQVRLGEISPLLSLKWHSVLGKWGLSYKWPEGDKRWQDVQNGKTPESNAFDILCWLPADCSPEEAYGYVVRTFQRTTDRHDVAKLLERVHLYNKKQQDSVKAEQTAYAEELLAANAGSLFRDHGKTAPKFYMNEGKYASKKRSKVKVIQE